MDNDLGAKVKKLRISLHYHCLEILNLYIYIN